MDGNNNTELVLSQFKKSTTRGHIAGQFPHAELIDGPSGGANQRFARLLFPDFNQARNALRLNGCFYFNHHKRQILFSIVADGMERPLYVLTRGLSPQTRAAHLVDFFQEVTEEATRAHVPLRRTLHGNTNRGFGFVYFQSYHDYVNGLTRHGGVLLGSQISVIPGALHRAPQP